MRSVPVFRILMLTAMFGSGLLAGHLLWPGSPGDAPATASGSTAPEPSPQSLATTSPAIKPWDGTVSGLLRIAAMARSAPRATVQLAALLVPLPAATIADLTKSFPWNPNLTWQQDAVMGALLLEWTEKDADGALKWAAGLPAMRSQMARREILRNLAASDPEKAIAAARRITPASDRSSLLADLSEVIAESDPEEALRLLRSGSQGPSDYRYDAIFRAWAGRDPAAAWAKALTLPGESRHSAASAVLNTWAVTDPATARDLALTLPAGRFRDAGIAAVFQAWSNMDPAKAHAAALKLPDNTSKSTVMRSVFEQWAAVDARAALVAAENLSVGSRRRQMLDAVYQQWANREPATAAKQIASTAMPLEQKSNLLAVVAGAWAQKDASAALAWAGSMTVSQGRAIVISQVLSRIAATDGAAAAEAWRGLPEAQQRSSLGSIIGPWASHDVDAALAFARTVTRPADRAQAIATCAAAIGFSEPARLSAALADIPAGPIRVQALRSILANPNDPFGGNTPDGAADWLRSLPEQDRTAALGEGVNWIPGGEEAKSWARLLADTPGLTDQAQLWVTTASAIARDDPAAALTWAESIASPQARRQSIDAALQAWAGENPAAAMTKAQSVADEETRKSSVRNVVEIWARSDPEAVLAWAATASGPERELALLRGSMARVNYDPEAGAGIVRELLTESESEKPSGAVNTAAAQVAREWFRQDTAAGTQWALQLPDGPAREQAVSAIVQDWTRMDPIPASEWVRQLPPGDLRDTAASQLSTGILNSDPEGAFAWAISIADTAKREDAIRNASAAWISADKSAAKAALQQAPVSESLRTSLLKQIENAP